MAYERGDESRGGCCRSSSSFICLQPGPSQFVLRGFESGDTLAQEQATAAAKEKVLDALGTAASRRRSQLGESLSSVQKFNVPLSDATTSSLEALKAYSLGNKASGLSDSGLTYHQRAMELLPSFASGYTAVGWDYQEPLFSRRTLFPAADFTLLLTLRRHFEAISLLGPFREYSFFS